MVYCTMFGVNINKQYSLFKRMMQNLNISFPSF